MDRDGRRVSPPRSGAGMRGVDDDRLLPLGVRIGRVGFEPRIMVLTAVPVGQARRTQRRPPGGVADRAPHRAVLAFHLELHQGGRDPAPADELGVATDGFADVRAALAESHRDPMSAGGHHLRDVECTRRDPDGVVAGPRLQHGVVHRDPVDVDDVDAEPTDVEPRPTRPGCRHEGRREDWAGLWRFGAGPVGVGDPVRRPVADLEEPELGMGRFAPRTRPVDADGTHTPPERVPAGERAPGVVDGRPPRGHVPRVPERRTKGLGIGRRVCGFALVRSHLDPETDDRVARPGRLHPPGQPWGGRPDAHRTRESLGAEVAHRG